jgi:VIT1/CCC1 family predicted Fe2+/Mn2+ transporter
MTASGMTGSSNVPAAGVVLAAAETTVRAVAHPTGVEHDHQHRSGRSPWLRAAVLGANDGILSTAALVVGVAAAGSGRTEVLVAGVAAIFAGALSMAVGEYVSVSSQRDAEEADLAIEARALQERPRHELHELTRIYEERGVEPGLARLVAGQLMAKDELGAHARDELGITEIAQARPWQAAWTSALSFTAGAVWPVLAVLAPRTARIPVTVAVTLAALATLGAIGASLGGAPRGRGALRTLVLSSAALLISWLVGEAVGTAV